MWYVLRTAPGRQSLALDELEAIGIDAIAPVIRREVMHYQTKSWSMRRFPLFSGYVFGSLHGEADFDALRKMDHVQAVLGGSDGPIPIPTKAVIELCEAQNRGDYDILRPPPAASFAPDVRVRIESGPLAGAYARVTRAKGKGKRAVMAIVESVENMREIELSIANLRLAA
ncbi:NusG antitermination factor [Rhizobium sp. CF080]|uniref:transcription termination/antitermination protein NusG n=1 Tax=Rhizobium sp. (strain CF080) TaxID=1144310 RepID=UPI0002716F7E|nr:transcription termination/antitermination NusG family protein [Rhizobium sp. CF080]EUB95894.1 NusG antitermination factor [Rhizobium sp. CF080]